MLVAPVDGGAARQLTAEADGFVAPWWTPDGSVLLAVDDRIVSHAADGGTLVWLLTDDNFNTILQRTLLLLFRLD